MPSIIPSFGPRPTASTHSYTLVLTGPTATVGAGQTVFGNSIDTPGQSPGTYYNPSYGSPIVHVSHEFIYDWTLLNQGTIWNYSTKYSATGIWADKLRNSGLIVAEIEIPETGPGTTMPGMSSSSRPATAPTTSPQGSVISWRPRRRSRHWRPMTLARRMRSPSSAMHSTRI